MPELSEKRCQNEDFRKGIRITNISGMLAAITLLPYLSASNCPCEQWIIGGTIVLLAVPVIIEPFLTGELHTQINGGTFWAKLIIYIWAAVCFTAISVTIYWTGGTRNSPLIWVYELTTITALCLNGYSHPKKLESNWINWLNQNRLVVLAAGACIAALGFIGEHGVSNIEPYAWLYTIMAGYALLASILLFFLTKENWHGQTTVMTTD